MNIFCTYLYDTNTITRSYILNYISNMEFELFWNWTISSLTAAAQSWHQLLKGVKISKNMPNYGIFWNFTLFMNLSLANRCRIWTVFCFLLYSWIHYYSNTLYTKYKDLNWIPLTPAMIFKSPVDSKMANVAGTWRKWSIFKDQLHRPYHSFTFLII